MTCGLLDIGCHLQAAIAPYLFWLRIVLGVVACMGIAALLYWAYRIGRWPALVVGLLAVMFLAGYATRTYQDSAQPVVVQEFRYILTPEDIKAVQRALKERRVYKGAVDGDWGPLSKEAVRTVQRSIGEDETGTLTPGVRKALGVKLGG